MAGARKSEAELQKNMAALEAKIKEEFSNADKNISAMFEGKSFSESRRMIQDILAKERLEPSNSFINDIPDVDDIVVDKPKTTPIDEKLAALKKRIESNLSIIEKTNEKVNNINVEAEKTCLRSLSNDFDCDATIYGEGDSETCHVTQDSLSTEPTDEVPEDDEVPLEQEKYIPINEKLAALKKRIEMNLSIIKKTNEKVNNMTSEAEKACKNCLPTEFDYDEKTIKHMSGDGNDLGSKQYQKLPTIDEVKKSMENSMKIIDLAKSAASGDSTDNDMKMEKRLHELQNNC